VRRRRFARALVHFHLVLPRDHFEIGLGGRHGNLLTNVAGGQASHLHLIARLRDGRPLRKRQYRHAGVCEKRRLVARLRDELVKPDGRVVQGIAHAEADRWPNRRMRPLQETFGTHDCLRRLAECRVVRERAPNRVVKRHPFDSRGSLREQRGGGAERHRQREERLTHALPPPRRRSNAVCRARGSG
jgi:hypothetical protein